MNIGLPGAGIAGLFYLLAALWMPCHELGRTLRGERDPARWRRALTQAALALGIIATIVATAWAIGLLLPAPNTPAGEAPRADDGGAADAIRILGVTPTALAFVALAVVVLLPKAIALVIALRRRHATHAN